MRNKGIVENQASSYNPNGCKCCAGAYASVRLWLVAPDGKYHFLGYRAQCPYCKNVLWYDGKGAIFRRTSAYPDFGAQYWDTIKQFGLSAEAVHRAAYSKIDTRYFELYDFTEMTRHRAEFYEPKSRDYAQQYAQVI